MTRPQHINERIVRPTAATVTSANNVFLTVFSDCCFAENLASDMSVACLKFREGSEPRFGVGAH